jgi:parallel beta-helix repeat protein
MPVLELIAPDNAERDATLALEAALGSGASVVLRGGQWRSTGRFTLSPGARLIGAYGARLRIAGDVRGDAITMQDGSRIEGLTLDADKATKPYHYAYAIRIDGSGCALRDVEILNPKSEAIRIFGSYARLQALRIVNGDRSGIFLRGDRGTSIDDVLFENMAHFGVHAINGSRQGSLTRLRTYGQGLELVALLEDTHGFRVAHCHAEGTGDNGLSIGGYGHVVEGNQALNNAHAGITLFGRDNVCTGNRCQGNNRVRLTGPAAAFPGILLVTAFGSISWRNTVVGNWCGDYASPPLQWGCVAARKNAHVLWAPGATILGSNPYRSHGARCYKAVSDVWPVTCGATGPVHGGGDWVDSAGVLWRYTAGNGAPLDSKQNVVVGNVAHNNIFGSEFIQE